MNGMFISFEGPEGCGKTTQIQRAAEWLRAECGREVLCAREPGGTAVGEEIRRLLQHDEAGSAMNARCELLLFNASRAQLVDEMIRPALERGVWVLCDRFYDSTLAYQGFARGMPMAALRAVIDFAVCGLHPDLTLLLDISPEVSAERQALRGTAADRFERLDAAFHRRVREGYLELARREPTRIKTVDAAVPIDGVWDRVREELTGFLRRKEGA